MSNLETALPVVVGIDGSTDALRAVDWAAAEATRHGWPVRLVHAYQTAAAALPGVTVTLPPPVEEADRILDEAQTRIAASYPDLTVSMVRHEGPAPRVLLREAEKARLLVLGREGVGRFAEMVLGSVSLAVATKASTPVVVIPAAWDPPTQPFNRLVVGVDGSERCEAAVRFAFETAAEREAELTAVFAWDIPTRWPEAVPLMADTRRFETDYQQLLLEATQVWRDKYPTVAVDLVGEVGHPAEVLRRRAATADLVVIGGRGHGRVTGMLLGSAARAILRHVDRPIAVVHHPDEG